VVNRLALADHALMSDDDEGALAGDPVAEALERARTLPPEAVAAVFRRYGRPLAVELAPLAPDEPRADLALEGGAAGSVRVVELRMPVDVIANHWFVLEVPGEEDRLAVAGPLFAAALAALARRTEA
jgi:hypothetical protein